MQVCILKASISAWPFLLAELSSPILCAGSILPQIQTAELLQETDIWAL